MPANRILDALRTGNARELDNYVDVDAILSQFAPLGGPKRAGVQRRFGETAVDRRVTTGNRLQGVEKLAARRSEIRWLQERDGRFAAENVR